MQNNEVNQLGGCANQVISTEGGGRNPYWLVKSSQRERERVVRLAYDDKDECLYAEPTIGGSITTRIGATGCSWKILEARIK